MDLRLEALSITLGEAAFKNGYDFVDMYAVFSTQPDLESLYFDNIHPNHTTGDILMGQAIASVLLLIPEPRTGTLLLVGSVGLAAPRRRTPGGPPSDA